MTTVLLLSLLSFTGEERPRHPLAPSIPLLTREEEKRIEDIIERFIQFDIGKVKGSAGKKAVEDFNGLGPEAIFQLIDGFNRGANMESSCPCVLIGRKISLILNSSEDAHLLGFAKENFGAGVTAKRHMAVVEDLKIAAQLRRTAVVRRLGAAPPLFSSTRSPLLKKSVDELREMTQLEGTQGRQAVEELGRRSDPKVVDVLADAAEEDSPTANAAQLALQKWIAKQPAKEVSALLKHSQTRVRRAAALQAGSQRSLAGDLIDLLTDNESAVVQAARASLTRISGGLDHGPDPDATIQQRDESIARWRGWSEKFKR